MQIGPRFRVGGSLGRLGDKLKHGVQKAASNPFVQGGLGLLTGGATLPLLAGAAGGFLKEKAGLGDVVKGAATGYGAGKLGQGARALGTSVLGHGAADAATTAATSTATGGPIVPSLAEPLVNGAGDFAPPSTGGFLSRTADRIGGVGGKALKFAEAHPNAAGAGLTALGNIAGNDSENRLRNAQAATLERQLGETEYDFQRRKEREAQYAAIWAPLGTAIGSGLSGQMTPPNLPRTG